VRAGRGANDGLGRRAVLALVIKHLTHPSSIPLFSLLSPPFSYRSPTSRRRSTSPSSEWAVNSNPNQDTSQSPPKVHSAWNSDLSGGGPASESTWTVPPPSYPPPQRRRSHEKKWLNEKLKKMGFRKESGGEGGENRKRRTSSGRILPDPVIDDDNDEGGGNINDTKKQR